MTMEMASKSSRGVLVVTTLILGGALLLLLLPPCSGTASSSLLDLIELPPGFEISYAATDIASARYMAFSPDGKVLFVGSYGDSVFALSNPDENGEYQTAVTIASSLHEPTGVAVAGNNGYLVIGTTHSLVVYDLVGLLSWIASGATGNAPNASAILNFEVGSQVHYLATSPTDLDSLYFSFPSVWNSNWTIPLPYASLMRINVTEIMNGISPSRGQSSIPPSISIAPEIIALGIRDSQGLAFSPVTGDLWFTENGCEYIGFKAGENKLCNFSNNNDLPPDELNRLPAAVLNHTISSNNNNDNISSVWNYGFPYCYGDNIPDPSFPNYETNCFDTIPSAASLEAHQAPLGMTFYPTSLATSEYAFPKQFYNNFLFVSHGSTYRQPLDGYNVQWVSLDETNTVIENVQVFAQGWLQTFANGTQQVLGRPDDVAIDPNEGSILITDDYNSCIYRVRYTA